MSTIPKLECPMQVSTIPKLPMHDKGRPQRRQPPAYPLATPLIPAELPPRTAPNRGAGLARADCARPKSSQCVRAGSLDPVATRLPRMRRSCLRRRSRLENTAPGRIVSAPKTGSLARQKNWVAEWTLREESGDMDRHHFLDCSMD